MSSDSDRDTSTWSGDRTTKLATAHRTVTENLSRRFLVVDDNKRVAKMLALLISRMGPHEVDMACDGPTTLEKALTFRPDIILLDIGMPGMDGYAVASMLRDHPQCERMLLVALTGYSGDEYREKSLAAGFDKHVVKPVELDTLQQLCWHPKLCEPPPLRKAR